MQWTVQCDLCECSSIIFMLNITCNTLYELSLQWRHNERDGVSNHQPHDCLLKAQIKENIKAHRPLWGEFTGEFPTQRSSNAENVSIWWRHHDDCSINSGDNQTYSLITPNTMISWNRRRSELSSTVLLMLTELPFSAGEQTIFATAEFRMSSCLWQILLPPVSPLVPTRISKLTNRSSVQWKSSLVTQRKHHT